MFPFMNSHMQAYIYQYIGNMYRINTTFTGSKGNLRRSCCFRETHITRPSEAANKFWNRHQYHVYMSLSFNKSCCRCIISRGIALIKFSTLNLFITLQYNKFIIVNTKVHHVRHLKSLTQTVHITLLSHQVKDTVYVCQHIHLYV